MADDPAWARDLLRQLGAEELLGHRLRRVADTAVMATYTAALAMLVDALAADDITPARCHRG